MLHGSDVADPVHSTAGAHLQGPRRRADGLPPHLGTLVLGGGCSGLATALALSIRLPSEPLAIVDGRTRPDPRTWCFWDSGENPVPEAVTASWIRWEIRTPEGVSIGSDPEHPYRMIRATDYRQAMRRRLALQADVTFLDGSHVSDTAVDLGASSLRTIAGAVEAKRILDARGPQRETPTAPGRVCLHQRFVGHWIRTRRPVFDHRTVTLMDFTGPRETADVQFMYVLPISSTEALIESTLFAKERHSPFPFRENIADYVEARWGLAPDEWTVTGEEAGCIAMTDERALDIPSALGVRAGLTRPSTGYAFTRIQRHSIRAADAVARGTALPSTSCPVRTRVLDAIFLRFLRDEPHRAAEVFSRLFGDLPGDVTVRFLTERSTIVDEIRLVLVLPKAPFLRALLATLRERVLGRLR